MIKVNLLKEVNKNASKDEDVSSKINFENLFTIKKNRSVVDNDSDDDFAESDGLISIILKVIIMVTGAVALFYYESVNIPELEARLSDLRAQASELQAYNNRAAKAVAEIKKAKEQKLFIEKQIASLDSLSKVRHKYIRVIELLQTSIPEKMWFTKITASANGMDLVGISHTESDITQFLELIGKSAYLSDATMVSSEDIASSNSEVSKFKQFNINIQFEGQRE